MSKQSNRDTSNYTPSFNAAAGHTYGVNANGNFYSTRGPSTAQGGAYHYSNRDGSYAYQNTNGSTYYANPNTGTAVYTPPAANPRNQK